MILSLSRSLSLEFSRQNSLRAWPHPGRSGHFQSHLISTTRGGKKTSCSPTTHALCSPCLLSCSKAQGYEMRDPSRWSLKICGPTGQSWGPRWATNAASASLAHRYVLGTAGGSSSPCLDSEMRAADPRCCWEQDIWELRSAPAASITCGRCAARIHSSVSSPAVWMITEGLDYPSRYSPSTGSSNGYMDSSLYHTCSACRGSITTIPGCYYKFKSISADSHSPASHVSQGFRRRMWDQHARFIFLGHSMYSV